MPDFSFQWRCRWMFFTSEWQCLWYRQKTKFIAICLLSFLWSICWFQLETRRCSSRHIKREVLALFFILFFSLHLFSYYSHLLYNSNSRFYLFSLFFYHSSQITYYPPSIAPHSSVKSTINFCLDLYHSLVSSSFLFSLAHNQPLQLVLDLIILFSCSITLTTCLLSFTHPNHTRPNHPTYQSLSLSRPRKRRSFNSNQPSTKHQSTHVLLHLSPTSSNPTFYTYKPLFPSPTPFFFTPVVSHPPHIPVLVPWPIDANEQQT